MGRTDEKKRMRFMRPLTVFMLLAMLVLGGSMAAEAKAKPILTGYANIDYMASRMLKKAGVKKGMSADQKVRKIYHYMLKKFKHVHYTSESIVAKLTPTEPTAKALALKAKNDAKAAAGKITYSGFGQDEEWNMQHRRGVCDDNSAVFVILCNQAGIKAGLNHGYYVNRDGSKHVHTWPWAKVNGKKYYYDIDVEIQNKGKGQGDYYWYKKSKSQAKKTHIFVS